MRISPWLTLLLAACSGADTEGATQSAGRDADRIACALAGSERFANDCAIERSAAGDGSLTLRHPDGGFRRLLLTRDGRGVVASDGAARAVVRTLADGRAEVTIEGDRYRLPAASPGR